MDARGVSGNRNRAFGLDINMEKLIWLAWTQRAKILDWHRVSSREPYLIKQDESFIGYV